MKDLHDNTSGLLWLKSSIHFTNQGSNRFRQVWWCMEEVSHLGEWESIQWLHHIRLSLHLPIIQVSASDGLPQNRVNRANKAGLCLTILDRPCSRRRCCLVTVWKCVYVHLWLCEYILLWCHGCEDIVAIIPHNIYRICKVWGKSWNKAVYAAEFFMSMNVLHYSKTKICVCFCD